MLTLCSSRSKADLARLLLNWTPEHGDDSFYGHFAEEVAIVAKEF